MCELLFLWHILANNDTHPQGNCCHNGVFDAKTYHCQLYDCTLVLTSYAAICQQSS